MNRIYKVLFNAWRHAYVCVSEATLVHRCSLLSLMEKPMVLTSVFALTLASGGIVGAADLQTALLRDVSLDSAAKNVCAGTYSLDAGKTFQAIPSGIGLYENFGGNLSVAASGNTFTASSANKHALTVSGAGSLTLTDERFLSGGLGVKLLEGAYLKLEAPTLSEDLTFAGNYFDVGEGSTLSINAMDPSVGFSFQASGSSTKSAFTLSSGGSLVVGNLASFVLSDATGFRTVATHTGLTADGLDTSQTYQSTTATLNLTGSFEMVSVLYYTSTLTGLLARGGAEIALRGKADEASLLVGKTNNAGWANGGNVYAVKALGAKDSTGVLRSGRVELTDLSSIIALSPGNGEAYALYADNGGVIEVTNPAGGVTTLQGAVYASGSDSSIVLENVLYDTLLDLPITSDTPTVQAATAKTKVAATIFEAKDGASITIDNSSVDVSRHTLTLYNVNLPAFSLASVASGAQIVWSDMGSIDATIGYAKNTGDHALFRADASELQSGVPQYVPTSLSIDATATLTLADANPNDTVSLLKATAGAKITLDGKGTANLALSAVSKGAALRASGTLSNDQTSANSTIEVSNVASISVRLTQTKMQGEGFATYASDGGQIKIDGGTSPTAIFGQVLAEGEGSCVTLNHVTLTSRLLAKDGGKIVASDLVASDNSPALSWSETPLNSATPRYALLSAQGGGTIEIASVPDVRISTPSSKSTSQSTNGDVIGVFADTLNDASVYVDTAIDLTLTGTVCVDAPGYYGQASGYGIYAKNGARITVDAHQTGAIDVTGGILAVGAYALGSQEDKKSVVTLRDFPSICAQSSKTKTTLWANDAASLVLTNPSGILTTLSGGMRAENRGHITIQGASFDGENLTAEALGGTIDFDGALSHSYRLKSIRTTTANSNAASVILRGGKLSASAGLQVLLKDVSNPGDFVIKDSGVLQTQSEEIFVKSSQTLSLSDAAQKVDWEGGVLLLTDLTTSLDDVLKMRALLDPKTQLALSGTLSEGTLTLTDCEGISENLGLYANALLVNGNLTAGAEGENALGRGFAVSSLVFNGEGTRLDVRNGVNVSLATLTEDFQTPHEVLLQAALANGSSEVCVNASTLTLGTLAGSVKNNNRLTGNVILEKGSVLQIYGQGEIGADANRIGGTLTLSGGSCVFVDDSVAQLDGVPWRSTLKVQNLKLLDDSVGLSGAIEAQNLTFGDEPPQSITVGTGSYTKLTIENTGLIESTVKLADQATLKTCKALTLSGLVAKARCTVLADETLKIQALTLEDDSTLTLLGLIDVPEASTGSRIQAGDATTVHIGEECFTHVVIGAGNTLTGTYVLHPNATLALSPEVQMLGSFNFKGGRVKTDNELEIASLNFEGTTNVVLGDFVLRGDLSSEAESQISIGEAGTPSTLTVKGSVKSVGAVSVKTGSTLNLQGGNVGELSVEDGATLSVSKALIVESLLSASAATTFLDDLTVTGKTILAPSLLLDAQTYALSTQSESATLGGSVRVENGALLKVGNALGEESSIAGSVSVIGSGSQAILKNLAVGGAIQVQSGGALDVTDLRAKSLTFADGENCNLSGTVRIAGETELNFPLILTHGDVFRFAETEGRATLLGVTVKDGAKFFIGNDTGSTSQIGGDLTISGSGSEAKLTNTTLEGDLTVLDAASVTLGAKDHVGGAISLSGLGTEVTLNAMNSIGELDTTKRFVRLNQGATLIVENHENFDVALELEAGGTGSVTLKDSALTGAIRIEEGASLEVSGITASRIDSPLCVNNQSELRLLKYMTLTSDIEVADAQSALYAEGVSSIEPLILKSVFAQEGACVELKNITASSILAHDALTYMNLDRTITIGNLTIENGLHTESSADKSIADCFTLGTGEGDFVSIHTTDNRAIEATGGKIVIGNALRAFEIVGDIDLQGNATLQGNSSLTLRHGTVQGGLTESREDSYEGQVEFDQAVSVTGAVHLIHTLHTNDSADVWRLGTDSKEGSSIVPSVTATHLDASGLCVDTAEQSVDAIFVQGGGHVEFGCLDTVDENGAVIEENTSLVAGNVRLGNGQGNHLTLKNLKVTGGLIDTEASDTVEFEAGVEVTGAMNLAHAIHTSKAGDDIRLSSESGATTITSASSPAIEMRGGHLQIGNHETKFTVVGSLDVGADSTLSLIRGTVQGDVVNDGSLEIHDAIDFEGGYSQSAALSHLIVGDSGTNASTLNIQGRCAIEAGTVHVNGALNLEGDQSTLAGSITNVGSIEVQGNQSRIGGEIQNQGIFKVTGASATLQATVHNTGTFLMASEAAVFNGEICNAGILRIASDATGQGGIVNSAELSIEADTTVGAYTQDAGELTVKGGVTLRTGVAHITGGNVYLSGNASFVGSQTQRGSITSPMTFLGEALDFAYTDVSGNLTVTAGHQYVSLNASTLQGNLTVAGENSRAQLTDTILTGELHQAAGSSIDFDKKVSVAGQTALHMDLRTDESDDVWRFASEAGSTFTLDGSLTLNGGEVTLGNNEAQGCVAGNLSVNAGQASLTRITIKGDTTVQGELSSLSMDRGNIVGNLTLLQGAKVTLKDTDFVLEHLKVDSATLSLISSRDVVIENGIDVKDGTLDIETRTSGSYVKGTVRVDGNVPGTSLRISGTTDSPTHLMGEIQANGAFILKNAHCESSVGILGESFATFSDVVLDSDLVLDSQATLLIEGDTTIKGQLTSAGSLVNTATLRLTGDVHLASGLSGVGEVEFAGKNVKASGKIFNSVLVQSDTTFENDATIKQSVTNEGEIYNSGVIEGEILNRGVFQSDANDLLGRVFNDGELTVKGGEAGNCLTLDTPISGSGVSHIVGAVKSLKPIQNTLIVERESAFDNAHTIQGTVLNYGFIASSASSITGSIQNEGALSLSGENHEELTTDITGEGTTTVSGSIQTSALIENALQVQSGAYFELTPESRVNGTLTNEGTVLNHGLLCGTVTNHGTLKTAPDAFRTGLVNTGVLTLTQGQLGSSVTGDGTIEMTEDVRNDKSLEGGIIRIFEQSTFENTGTLCGHVENAGTLKTDPKWLNGSIENTGTLEFTGSDASEFSDILGDVSGSGKIILRGLVRNTKTIENEIAIDGTLKNDGQLQGAIDNTGTLFNSGTLEGHVTNSGILKTNCTGLQADIRNSGRVILTEAGVIAHSIEGGTVEVDAAVQMAETAGGSLDELSVKNATLENNRFTVAERLTLQRGTLAGNDLLNPTCFTFQESDNTLLEDLTCETLEAKSGSTLAVGSGEAATTLSVTGNLKLNGATLVLDPEVATSVDEATHMTIAQGIAVDGKIHVANNAVLTLGASDWRVSQSVFETQPFVFGSDIKTLLHVVTPTRFSEGGGITLGGQSVTAGGFKADSQSLTIVDGDALEGNAALSGLDGSAISIASDAKLYLNVATYVDDTCYVILEGQNLATDATQYWTQENIVLTDDTFRIEPEVTSNTYALRVRYNDVSRLFPSTTIPQSVNAVLQDKDHTTVAYDFVMHVIREDAPEVGGRAFNALANLGELASLRYSLLDRVGAFDRVLRVHETPWEGSHLWVDYVHAHTKVDAMPLSGICASYRREDDTLTMGCDLINNLDYAAGLAASYTKESLKGESQSVQKNAKFWSLALYGRKMLLGGYLKGECHLGVTHSENTLNETVDGFAIHAKPDANALFASLMLRATTPIAPYVGARWTKIHVPEYSNNFGFTFSPEKTQCVSLPIGLDFHWKKEGKWSKWETTLGVGYTHNFGVKDVKEKVSYKAGCDTLSTDIAPRSSGLASMAVNYDTAHLTARIGARYHYARHASSWELGARLGVRF